MLREITRGSNTKVNKKNYLKDGFGNNWNDIFYKTI
jgi:hypothetical protein